MWNEHDASVLAPMSECLARRRLPGHVVHLRCRDIQLDVVAGGPEPLARDGDVARQWPIDQHPLVPHVFDRTWAVARRTPCRCTGRGKRCERFSQASRAIAVSALLKGNAWEDILHLTNPIVFGRSTVSRSRG
jgi:hypothetical protein